MRTIDANGQQLTAPLFIWVFNEARQIAPPRFITLLLHPDRLRELEDASRAPEVIQLGDTPGPLGRKIRRVNCVKPPIGIGDGVAIQQDDKADPTKLQFLVHGIAELELKNLAATDHGNGTS